LGTCQKGYASWTNCSFSGKVRRDMTKPLVRVQSVEPHQGFVVDVHFTDGSQREINLAPYLQGPIFEPIRNDPSLFHALQVEEGTIAWPNGGCHTEFCVTVQSRKAHRLDLGWV
jgi:Protein of unknown function (DUF2442)